MVGLRRAVWTLFLCVGIAFGAFGPQLVRRPAAAEGCTLAEAPGHEARIETQRRVQAKPSVSNIDGGPGSLSTLLAGSSLPHASAVPEDIRTLPGFVPVVDRLGFDCRGPPA